MVADRPDLARARALAGLRALKAGDRDRAAAYTRLAEEALAQQPGLSPYYRQPLERFDALLRSSARRHSARGFVVQVRGDLPPS